MGWYSFDARYFQISVLVQPGNSGDALADEHGNVVPVIVSVLTGQVTGDVLLFNN
ncbi:MAG: hypothetical protein ABSC01_08225 [Verrucomicrobiota bacterium]|jgi:hypothetical protein